MGAELSMELGGEQFAGYVRDGMISRAYEYFDTGQIEKFIGPRS